MIIYCLAGVGAGIITGLVPGLHTNNIALLALASPLFGAEFAAFLLSMSIVHTFVDFVPSVFLGAPGTDTFEGVLPAHRLFLGGHAFEAVCLTVFGGIVALLGGIIFVPLFFLFIAENSEVIGAATPFVLVFALAVLVGTEKKRLFALFVVLCAAAQGIVFEGQIFPLITGFFGLPTILVSIRKRPKKIRQSGSAGLELPHIKEGLAGLMGGALVSVMPGIGSNVAAAIIKAFRRRIDSRKYLVLLGSINTSNFFFSFAVLFALSKARNGVMLALEEKIFFTQEMFWSGTAAMLLAGGLGALATVIISKRAVRFFSERKTKAMGVASIALMIGMVALLNGPLGLAALVFSTSLGLFAVLKKVKRSCCMASLIVPVVFFYVFYLI